MISEEDLRRMLAVTAASAEPPDDGVERILAARAEAEPQRARRSWSRPRRLARRGGGGTGAAARWREPRWVLAGLSLVALVVGGIGIGALSSSEDSASTSTTAVAPAPAAGDASTAESPRSSAGSTAGGSAPAAPRGSAAPTAPRVVQTGQITLQVDADRVSEAVDRLGAIAAGLRGYVSSSSTTDSSSPSGSVTLRVPADAYPQVLAETRGLGRVVRSSSDSRDVTGEVVDLTARIKTLQDTRASYQALLARAGTVDEILTVQQQITEVQSEIEQLQGQANVLADKSDLATVTVSVTAPSSSFSDSDDDRKGLGGAWDRAVSGFTGGVEWLVAASGPLLFVALLALMLALPVRWGVRFVRRRTL